MKSLKMITILAIGIVLAILTQWVTIAILFGGGVPIGQLWVLSIAGFVAGSLLGLITSLPRRWSPMLVIGALCSAAPGVWAMTAVPCGDCVIPSVLPFQIFGFVVFLLLVFPGQLLGMYLGSLVRSKLATSVGGQQPTP